MSEEQHTPGPWKVIREGSARVVVGNTGQTVVEHVYRADDVPLIAAAPDLLEACKAARTELSFVVHVAGRSGGLYEKALDKLEAAIAKATSPERRG